MERKNGNITTSMLGTSTYSESRLSRLISHLRQATVVGFSAIAVSMLAVSAQANLITNGDFEQTTLTASSQFTTQVTDWLNADHLGRVYLYLPGTATTTGANYTPAGIYPVILTGVEGVNYPSPNGGNFVGIDSGFNTPITQTVSGLTGGQYILSFDWAAAQQKGVTGDTLEQWQVTLGSETHSTSVILNKSQQFTGWFHETFTYTVPDHVTSETLTFLAVGTPTGIPPFALLDSVTLDAAPEPASLLLMGSGVLGVLAARRRRKKRV
jgi:hypothetical protein